MKKVPDIVAPSEEEKGIKEEEKKERRINRIQKNELQTFSEIENHMKKVKDTIEQNRIKIKLEGEFTEKMVVN